MNFNRIFNALCYAVSAALWIAVIVAYFGGPKA